MSHYYYKDGSHAYQVEKKNGKIDKPNIADARRLKLIPSVTTVLGILAAPELERWKINQVLDTAYGFISTWVKSLPNRLISTQELIQKIEPKACFSAKTMSNAFKKADKAREWGDCLHAYMESLCLNMQCGAEQKLGYSLIPQETKESIKRHFLTQIKEVVASEQPLACEESGIAGTPDLVCYLKDGRLCIYDFKNQWSKGKKEFGYYEKYWMQPAAYAKVVKADCLRILMVSRDEPGKVEMREISGQDMIDFQVMYKACVIMFNMRKKLRKHTYEEVEELDND